MDNLEKDSLWGFLIHPKLISNMIVLIDNQ